tara:strand:- start:4113 stop:4550 length:438 start_codon:yes stop_codon:yes gene_type:complete
MSYKSHENNISHENPYANAPTDHRDVDSDYFSSMAHIWASEGQPVVQADLVSLDQEIEQSTSTEEVSFVGEAATNPSHYNSVPSHLQHWDVVHQMGWDYYLGCATKYIWRAGKKKSAAMDDATKEIQDLEKAVVYLNKKIEILKG